MQASLRPHIQSFSGIQAAAKELGVNPSTVWRWLVGTSQPATPETEQRFNEIVRRYWPWYLVGNGARADFPAGTRVTFPTAPDAPAAETLLPFGRWEGASFLVEKPFAVVLQVAAAPAPDESRAALAARQPASTKESAPAQG